jgi:hypothetical protein
MVRRALKNSGMMRNDLASKGMLVKVMPLLPWANVDQNLTSIMLAIRTAKLSVATGR